MCANPRGYSLIWPIRGCADGQTMVLDRLSACPKQGI